MPNYIHLEALVETKRLAQNLNDQKVHDHRIRRLWTGLRYRAYIQRGKYPLG